MARMIPTFGPAETESPAEPAIYHLLKKQLSDDYVVIHSLPWLSAASAEIGMSWSAPTGEIDFLILHAKLGMLAIEIKGGCYRIDGAAFVPIAGGRPQFALNQVRRNSHGVAHWLGGKGTVRWPIGYAVGVPNNVYPDDALPPGLYDSARRQRILFDMRDLSNLGTKVAEVMAYWRSALELGELGDARMKAAIEMLCPQFDGTPQWAHRIHYDGRFWLRLTEDQSSIADRVLQARGGIVTGWPGTGKTLIGLEIARRLSAAGERVLFLTFNALLCDHLRLQLKESTCQVFTWHKLCNLARELLGRPSGDADWFERQCLDDLRAAVGHHQISFDVLIVDEAQAFRPQWWELLCSWFNGKPIFAFCDETQVFSLERETSTLASLIAASGLKQMQLSIVLRMPKAVTNRLIEAMPGQLQISSPRQLDPETLHEIAVVDWRESMNETVSQLISRGAKHSDIVVLSRTGYVKDSIEEFLNANGELKHSLVSRFRGMESPIIIVVEAHDLSDSELFCAYSRATTACFALYAADCLGDDPLSRFQAKVSSIPAYQEVIREAKQRRTAAFGLSGHDMRRVDRVHTVDLTWSRTLKSFLVRLPRETPAVLWVDYLCEVAKWPVLIITDEEPDALRVALPGKNSQEGLQLKVCRKCEMTTPHHFFPLSSCLVCTKVLGGDARVLKERDVHLLVELDSLMSSLPASASVEDAMAIYYRTPFLLGAAAVGGHVWRNMYVEKPPNLPGDVSLYRAAIALAYSYAHLCGGERPFSLDELVEQTWHGDFDDLGVDRNAWHKQLRSALSRLNQQEVIFNDKKCVENRKGMKTQWRIRLHGK